MKNQKLDGFVVRPAQTADCVAMKNIINTHAAHGLMRPKSISQLRVRLLHYFVADFNGKIIGVCGLKIWPDDGVEIISSAVLREFHNQGVGVALNKQVIKTATSRGFTKFFVLTKQPGFYAKLGFVEISKSMLANKTYEDCSGCAENTSEDIGHVLCSDIAMQLLL